MNFEFNDEQLFVRDVARSFLKADEITSEPVEDLIQGHGLGLVVDVAVVRIVDPDLGGVL